MIPWTSCLLSKHYRSKTLLIAKRFIHEKRDYLVIGLNGIFVLKYVIELDYLDALWRLNLMVLSKYIHNINARKYLRFIEWTAFLRLVYDTDNTRMSVIFPEYTAKVFDWHNSYTNYVKRNAYSPKARALQIIYLDLLNNKIADLDEFYIRLVAALMIRKLGKVSKNITNVSANSLETSRSYQKKGLASKDNNMLVHLMLEKAVVFANTNYTLTELSEVVNTLVLEHYKSQLTRGELAVLQRTFTKKVNAMEKSITRPEATILRHPLKKLAKNTYHLYGLFKLECQVGDTWELPLTKLTKEQLCVGKPAALEAVDLLIKLKLIEICKPGKQQVTDPRATVYKRLK